MFGGLLGSTFNYVFENQLTNLQNGDRFYYLGRTPGMNLRAQLESNSFSELVMRNTDAFSLKADPFATADCKFHLGDIPAGTAVAGSFLTGPGTVSDVGSSECDENRLLLRQPNGRIEYRAINSVDPSGINGQAVYDGTPLVDRIFGGNDNDTFWGREGNDIIDGRGGDDVVLGGEGNDIITDLGGFDVLKGGPGNDAIDGGVFDDIIMGGDGDDFTNGGANNDEHFMGAGDDFTIGGQGFSAVFGDSGDDWMEGGDMADLLIGDSSTLFFDDHNVPGHDVTIGQGGDDDYDTEGGDDVMVGGPGVEKNAGASGYDWLIGVGDPQPQFADLNLKILPEGQPAIEVRDRFNEVEALSGWKFDDQLFGDDPAPAAVGGGGFIGCDVLSQSGLDRIAGLDAYIPDLTADPADTGTTPANDILGNTTTRYCLIEPDTNVWGAGNILLGGAGNDRIEGRGADDIIDGDTYMNVRLSVRTDVNSPATEFATTPLLENVPTGIGWTGALAGKSLQQAVFAGLIDPGSIAIVREILLPEEVPAADCGADIPLNCDTALFSASAAGYVITNNDDGSVTVSDADGAAVDGTDTLWNMERASFCDVVDANGRCTASTLVALVDQADSPLLTVTTPAGVGVLAVDFGAVNTLPPSATENITIGNAGTAPLTVSNVTVTGVDAGQFTATPAAGCTSIAAGSSCIISVRFAPTSVGAKVAAVNITHNSLNAAGTVTSVSLDGIGAAPIADVAPAALAFGSVSNGTTSAPQTITVTNDGDAPLTVASIGVTGTNAALFTATPTGCNVAIAPGATCQITVQFAPTTAGLKTATVSITHNSNNVAGSVSNVPLTGTGVATPPPPGPQVTMPTTFSFGARRINADRTEKVVVTNQGPGALVITNVTTSGAPFTATRGDCPASLAAGRSCKLNVTFRPLLRQSYTGTLTLTSNASNNPTVTTLTGSGR